MNCGLFWIELCLVWVKKDNSLPCTALYTDFSESKKSRSKECKPKDFRRSNAAAKARLRGGLHSKECKRLPQLTTPPKSQKSTFRTIRKAVLRNRRATGARIWGSVRN